MKKKKKKDLKVEMTPCLGVKVISVKKNPATPFLKNYIFHLFLFLFYEHLNFQAPFCDIPLLPYTRGAETNQKVTEGSFHIFKEKAMGL